MYDVLIKVDSALHKQFDTPSTETGLDTRAVFNAYGRRSVRFQLFNADRKTARAVPTGAAYQLSLTEPADWSQSTPPLIRISADLFTVIDAPTGILEANVLTASAAFNAYVQGKINNSTSGRTDGAMELIEYLVTNSDTDTLAVAVAALDKTFTATDSTKYAVGDKVVLLGGTPETVIVTSIDTETDIIGFSGTGTAGGTLYNHALGSAIDIKTVNETILLQYPCTFCGRRDLGGQSITSEGETALSYAAAVALNNTKADKTGALDIEITDPTKGLILRAPDGTRWRLIVENGGKLSQELITS